MLVYLVCWTLLAGSGMAVGSALLALAEPSSFSWPGDRAIAATWLGLLTIAATFLGLSVLVPLSPAVGGAVILVFGTLSLSRNAVRETFRDLKSHASLTVVLGLLLLAAAAAWNATRFVEAYDTGLYHYPLARWLAAYGTVRGLALIHFRFGFSSSWFALDAPFDAGALQGRMAAMLGGLASFLCLAHLAMAAARIVQRRARPADWFLAGGYAFILSVCFSWAFEVSLSPDLPVWILTLLVGWLMTVSAGNETGGMPSSCVSPLAVLLLAICTLTLKPSAAPIVAVAGIFFLFTSRQSWPVRLAQAAATGVLAIPIVAANLTTSGCPVYPSPAFCMDVPWGVGKTAAREIATDIGDWGRWRDAATPAAQPSGNWLSAWVTQPDKLALLLLCGICLIGFLAARGWRAGRGVLFALGLAIVGTAFLFANAPNPRFGVGYFALFPALLLAAVGPKLISSAEQRIGSDASWRRALACGLVGLAVVVTAYGTWRQHRLLRELDNADNIPLAVDATLARRIFLAPALASSPGDPVITRNRKLSRVGRLELVTDSSNGVDYLSPKDRDQCWGAALPCVPVQPEGDISLRVPAEGLRSGFVHSNKLGDVSRR
jgi:hypothetical protein